MRQIDDWRNWLSRNRDYASRAAELSGLGLGDIDPELDGLVILGRAEFLDAAVEDRRRRLARQNRIRIEPYEWLISQAAERAKPRTRDLYGLLFPQDEFEAMRARRAVEAVFGTISSPTVFVSAIRSVDYEFLLLDETSEDNEDDSSDQEVVYHEVRGHRANSSSRLERDDWDDWRNSPAMEFFNRISLLVTEIEPSRELQNLLTPLGPGLWAELEASYGTLWGAHFLLFLPLDMPSTEKESRCRAARDQMQSLFPADVATAREEGER
jgi:hypothetical protein